MVFISPFISISYRQFLYYLIFRLTEKKQSAIGGGEKWGKVEDKDLLCFGVASSIQ